MKLVWDIETDGLDATKIWCLVAIDVDTGLTYKFSDYDDDLLGSAEAKALLLKADVHIGHNLIGYDMLQVKKIWGLNLFDKKVYDTWIMSQVLNMNNQRLPKNKFGKPLHGLGGWGQALGNQKFDFHEWDAYTKEMLTYCVQDVRVNLAVYNELLKDYANIAASKPLIKDGLRIEMETAKFEAITRTIGWKFDMPKAQITYQKMLDRLAVIEATINPKLPPIVKLIDKAPKVAKFTKKGDYTSVTARILSEYLGKTVLTTDIGVWPAGKEYQRKITVKAEMANLGSVKEFLYSIGWKPDDWKMTKTAFGWEQGAPKLTTTSLEKLGEDGLLVDEWTTLRSRKNVLRGWIELATPDNRLRGRMWIEGTPTFRCRHEVITNLPAVTAAWGKELRELLIAEDGYKVVGADSSGNQFRSLAHYVKDAELTKQILSGDIHAHNRDIIGLKGDEGRRVAKTWIYAFLFGAGPTKLGQILTGSRNPGAGNKSITAYGNAIPGLKRLKDRIESMWKQTSSRGDGYIPGLDGRKVYTPQSYQTLNYLLQSCEAITCKSAIAYAMEHIKAEGLDASPRMFYHDEQAWVASEKDAPRVQEILEASFREGPKTFNVMDMDGEGKIGDNYADVH